jgi:hypothetical protein
LEQQRQNQSSKNKMAISQKRTPEYAQNALDTADIVREAMLQQFSSVASELPMLVTARSPGGTQRLLGALAVSIG